MTCWWGQNYAGEASETREVGVTSASCPSICACVWMEGVGDRGGYGVEGEEGQRANTIVKERDFDKGW